VIGAVWFAVQVERLSGPFGPSGAKDVDLCTHLPRRGWSWTASAATLREVGACEPASFASAQAQEIVTLRQWLCQWYGERLFTAVAQLPDRGAPRLAGDLPSKSVDAWRGPRRHVGPRLSGYVVDGPSSPVIYCYGPC